MGQSNRSAVEANKIDPDERLDLVVPRNGSLTIRVELTDDADEPVNLTGETIVAGVFRRSTIAMTPAAPFPSPTRRRARRRWDLVSSTVYTIA
jgi:hypothetical protein